MNEGVQLIAGVASIVSTLIAILEYFKIRRISREKQEIAQKNQKITEKNQELEKKVQNIASTGVALGYYYNFVVEILSKLREAKLKIEIYKDDATEIETVKSFDTEDVKLHIILPNDLKISSMDNALRKMRMHRKGDIVSKGAKRNFGINFRFDGADKIVILDFPKPLNAIREHLMLDPQFVSSLGSDGKMKKTGLFDSEEWKRAEQDEIENFKATIYELMSRARPGENSHYLVDFVQVDDVPME